MKKVFIPPQSRFLFSLFTSGFLFLLILGGCNKEEPTDLRIKEMNAQEVSQMASKIESLVSPELSEGLTLKLWAVDSLVADPISIDVDDQGRLFYARTNRQENSEFDIRGHQDWEIESISLQTVEDKRAFLHKTLSPENSDKNEWLADLNGDGSHDWKDMTIEKENIFRLEDKDGDGLADFSQLMIEDFHDEVTDVAGAVMAYEDDIYVGVGPDMWRVMDKNGDGIADEKTSISHGYGIHIGFGAHGMSGLEMGPDGRIYWGIGDIGFNGVGPDGKEWKYPNRGVIVRANPDGSDFEVFAMGVRNTHEFVFDEYGNLISQDNDGDHPGESERLVYIVNGSDTGWRINWQFGKYRDPDNNEYKVWMDEELYKPRFEGQAAYITPTIKNFVNGPTGMVYNPGTALSPKWKNTFFVAEFVGNPARSGIHAFKLKAKGATFELAETEKILGNVLATGLDFGPDGSMYVADWIDGWGTKDYGRVWKLDAPGGDNWEERKQTAEILPQDFSQFPLDQLSQLLKNPDQRVRQKAQFELARRGEQGAATFEENIAQTDNQLARVHAIWGLAQIARMQDLSFAQPLVPLLQDKDPEIRAQAARWLGDIRYQEAGDELIALLDDDFARARFFAAEALGRIAYTEAVQPLISLLEANADEDAYIRHAASLALARINNVEAIVELHDYPSRAVRMGAVLALRRMGDAGITNFLEDEDELIVTEAARAINDDFSIEAALPALGDVLQKDRFTHEALIRRAINANLRVGTDEAMQNLIDYALSASAPAEMRAEAIATLSTWARPSVLDRVTGRYRGEMQRDASELKMKAGDALISLTANQENSIRLSATQAIGKLKVETGTTRLMAVLQNDADPEVRVAALRALANMNTEQMDQAIEEALTDNEKMVRIAGLDLMKQMDISNNLKVVLLSEVIDKRTVEEKQAALLTLGSLPVSETQATFEQLLKQLENGNLHPGVQLELAEAIDSTHSEALKMRFEEIQSSMSPNEQLASYQAALYGGDPDRGSRLLYRHPTAQCLRCHAYGDYGGSAGPRLNGVGERLSREQLLEALIDPSARLAPGFGVVTLEMEGGATVSGIYQGETDHEITLKIGNQPDTTIIKDQIVKRNNAASSMPDMKNFLSKKEIRDLVSLLATLKNDHM
ncbi:quinoprotein glucose dehydrogenase [Catalinimonas alkaloidigena]|uniref:HEAT repeat domain-containing protein n=1 Tax=Catalinimonas alkaloidigena TaxID=1075417 RepID=UPI002407188E|nr:HEAT repeat domain-containing protein [Catalinimonas alkaloidigena]MDF9797121.1 quinoprotein glucose dehydrogenase [Catalinimonas alkaloidigena]